MSHQSIIYYSDTILNWDIFEDFGGASQGGAASISDHSLEIYNTVFKKCSASSEGGGIYLNNGYLKLFCSQLSECSTSSNGDNKGGNAMTLIKYNLEIESTLFYHCPDRDSHGNSIIIFDTGNSSMNYANNSECYLPSNEGDIYLWLNTNRCVLNFSLFECNKASTVLYKSVIIDADSINIVNNNIGRQVLDATTIRMSNCCLFNNKANLGSGTFTNCYSEKSNNAILGTSYTTNRIAIKSVCHVSGVFTINRNL